MSVQHTVGELRQSDPNASLLIAGDLHDSTMAPDTMHQFSAGSAGLRLQAISFHALRGEGRQTSV